MKYKDHDKLLSNNKMKLYSLIAIFFINLALIGINYAPVATSYEVSIFSAYPFYVWVSLFLAMTMGIILILDSYEKIWKIFGVLLIFSIDLIFLTLPLLRNYAFYGRSDVISHLAYINEILLNGHIGTLNYYPISHILVSNLHILSAINVNTLMYLAPALFFMIYFAGLYLFSNEITLKRSESFMILLLGSVLIFSYYGTMFLPTQMSFSLIPLLLFLMIRSKSTGKNLLTYSIIFLIFLILMPFFHPLTSVNIIFLISITSITMLILSKNMNKNKLFFDHKNLLNPLLFVLVSFLAWFSSKTVFNSNVAHIYNWLVNEVGTPTMDTYKYSLSSSNLSLFQVIEKILLTYGNEIIYISIAILAMIYFLYHSFKKRELNYNTVFLTLCIITFTFLSGIFLLGAYGISNPLREFVYVLFFATIINGIFFDNIIHKNRSKLRNKFIKCVLVLLVISCSILGLYSSYASVSIGETNNQITAAEFTGMDWFYNNRNPNVKIYDLDKTSIRFSDVYNGMNYTKIKRWMFKSAPYNFKFSQERGYLILNEYVTKRYTYFWPDNPYFSKNDFENLNYNPLVNKVYDNGDDQIWNVNKV